MENQETEGRPAGAQQYLCRQCGARLDFSPGTSALKCPYCGFELQIQTQSQIAELDYRSYLEKAGQEQSSHEAQKVRCDQCGAETTVPGDAAAGICPFCGTNMVFSKSVSRLIKPEGLLPFKVPYKEAFEYFRRWIQGLWFAPRLLKQHAQSEGKLAGVYIPYWTYDSHTTTSYSGERGDYYYTYSSSGPGNRTQRERHTRWTPASGTVGNSFDDVLVLASKSLPKKYADRLEPWDLTNLVPYTDEYLSGFRAESYQVSLAEGFEAAKQIMAPAIEASIRQDIGGDEQQIRSAQTRYADVSFKHILLPVWLSAYRFQDKIFRILINARTGEIQGERPYSPWKIAGAVLAGLAIIGILILINALRN